MEKRTTGSIAGYTEAVRRRYLRALNKERGRILDLFASLTGYHRKAVIARCAEQTCPGQAKSVGILKLYGAALVHALKTKGKQYVIQDGDIITFLFHV